MKKIVLLIIVLISTIILTDTLKAQSQIELRRKAEHNEVRYYMEQRLAGQTVKQDNVSVKNNSFDKYAWYEKTGNLLKPTGMKDRKTYFMNGNAIKTEITNYGGIGPGYGLIRNVNNLVWKNLGYIFQFCPFVAASVKSGLDTTQRIHIVSDGLWDYPSLREVSPNKDTLWMWQPLEGYADPNQPYMASNPAPDNNKDGKPDSWPSHWYNPVLGKYVWPGYLSQDATNADLEVFWAMDDRDNAEFPYYPFVKDSTRRGIGIQVDGRALQWSNALAENTIFFVYTITNISDKDLDTVFFGIYGDPDLGGASPENTDDNGLFVPPYNYDGQHDVSKIPVYARSLVYFWDPDMKGDKGLRLGYLGCKFLESPGNPNNGIDDDGDGMIDESQSNGIDDDKDWNPFTDDVGIDGVPNTGDFGEGDGLPTAGKKLPDGSLDPLYPGEPNFELTDLDEADQLGLTSFNSWVWNADKVANDESMWNRLRPANFSEIQQNTDIVFIFGSGPISLKRGETKRISMALLLGETLDDLLTSAETVQRIYNANYRFFRPPEKPHVIAVPDDKKVTLYWDNTAETSVDPLTGKDFEGYVIFRSTDPDFNDVKTITDGKGAKFLYQPLRDLDGFEAKWDVDKREEPYKDINNNGKWDTGEPFNDINGDGKWTASVDDWWKGYHPVEYQNRGIHYYLGNNRGIVHSYVDSNNVINGQTYYYAVVAYDHGDSVGVPPTETTKKITLDPITNQYIFDVNTVQVIPGPRSAGYVAPSFSDLGIKQESGLSNGIVKINILNDLEVKDNINYTLTFSDTLYKGTQKILTKNFSIFKDNEMIEEVGFIDTNFTKLRHENLFKGFKPILKSKTGTVFNENTDYIIDYERGLIRRTKQSPLSVTEKYVITYKYYPIYQSTKMNLEDSNPVFDGMRAVLKDYPMIMIDTIRTKWIKGNTNFKPYVQLASVGRKIPYPADYELSFSSKNIDSAVIISAGKYVKIPVKYSLKEVTSGISRPVLTYLKENVRDSTWQPGEEIVIFTPTSTGLATDTTTWGVIIAKPTDTTITPKAPTDGDVLFIGTYRPFTTKDVYKFTTKAAKFDNEKAKGRLDNIYVVPNPYVAANDIEPTTKLPGQTRGERRIYFENLPQTCTIRIYTISGDHVVTLEHNSTLANGREYWNLLNKDGFSVAYGIYLAHIDAPGIGEKLIKFAIIK